MADKIGDYGTQDYGAMLDQAIKFIPTIVKSQQFKAQMSRFIDSSTVDKMLSTDAHLDYLSNSTVALFAAMRADLGNALRDGHF